MFERKCDSTEIFLDPTFIPVITLKGNTYNSVTVGWYEESPEFFHYYKILIKDKEGKETYYESSENPYMIENLQPFTNYRIKVSLP